MYVKYRLNNPTVQSKGLTNSLKEDMAQVACNGILEWDFGLWLDEHVLFFSDLSVMPTV